LTRATGLARSQAGAAGSRVFSDEGPTIVRLIVTRAACAVILKPMKRQGKKPSRL
jgi:hypothetical protein